MYHERRGLVWDVDGRELIDYVGSWGPAILGHAPEVVINAVTEAVKNGTSFGIPSPLEVELAELICDWMPAIEKVRMVNSGTEATMSAIRLARGVTGRTQIVKFEGCYHGHGDSMLVKAGSGVATLGLPDSPGVPAALARETLTVPFNNASALAAVFVVSGGLAFYHVGVEQHWFAGPTACSGAATAADTLEGLKAQILHQQPVHGEPQFLT